MNSKWLQSRRYSEDILRKVAKDERMIKYNNLFFKAGCPAI